jgi:hypothetical protein
MTMTVPLSRDEIRRLAGDIGDDAIAGIEALGATVADLEIALQYAAGADDAMGKARHPLTGKAAQIHEWLTRDDEEERR